MTSFFLVVSRIFFPFSLAHKRIHDGRNVQFAQMGVLLSHAHKHNWFPSRMNHIDSSANFLINCIKLGQNDSIDRSRILNVHCEINQRLVELCQLIYSIISDKSFSYEKHDIRRVDMDELGQLSH